MRLLMVKVLKEYWQNYRDYRNESKRISAEIDKDGIYKYVEKHYGFGKESSKILKPRHA